MGSQPRRTAPAGALQLQLDHHAGRPVRKRTQRARHAARNHRIHLRAQRTHPPADRCENDHADMLRYWTSNDLAPTPCPKCGQEPTYIHLGMGVDPRSDDLRELPAQAARQWIVENSEPDELGAVPIPEERRGGLFTHVNYVPDCEHEEDCDCAEDEYITWVMDEFNTGPIRDEQDDVQQEHSAQVESQPEEATDDDDDDDYCIQTFRWDITPELLDECSESGHRRQAWLVISGKQKEAVTCPTCGQTPDFFDISTSGEQGLDFDAISETLNETHMASHEVFVEESEEDEHDVDDVTFTVQSHVFQHAEEWPKPGSTNLTRLPYPGDDAITLRWFRERMEPARQPGRRRATARPPHNGAADRRNPPDVHGRMPR